MVEVRRMDNFLESPGADYYWCNGCKLWHHHLVYCTVRADPTPDPIQAAQAAVVEAAEEYEARWGDPLMVPSQEGREIIEAVDDLRSLQQPKGLHPSEVEPGTRFRFALRGWRQGEKSDEVYMLYDCWAHGERMFAVDGGQRLMVFGELDRIIPRTQGVERDLTAAHHKSGCRAPRRRRQGRPSAVWPRPVAARPCALRPRTGSRCAETGQGPQPPLAD